MPVTLLINSYIFINGGIKCHVIFFFTFSSIVGIVFLHLVLINQFLESKPLTITRNIPYPFGVIKRYYSTSSQGTKNLKGIMQLKNSTRKTLSSPESRPYDDLYLGRGIPKKEQRWIKDNNQERSPFGASWAKYEKNRLSLPAKYPCNYTNITDPYNNRKLIKETCRGNRVVYIWT